MKVIRLTALCNSRLHPPGNIPDTHFCFRLSQPQGHSAAGRIMSIKNSNYTIGNRNLWRSSSTTATSRAPHMMQYWLIINCRLWAEFATAIFRVVQERVSCVGEKDVYISSPRLTVLTRVKLKTGAVSSSEASETINQYGVISHGTLISSYITYISIQIYFYTWQILQNCRIAYTFWSAPFKQSTGPTTKATASVKLRCDVEVTPILPFGLYLHLTVHKLLERILWYSRMWRQDR